MAPAVAVPACVTCGAKLSGEFCSHCGEKRIGPDDYSLRHFAEHSLDLLTHFDFKFFRSIRLLATRPGFLTERYLAGNRKPYLKPLQLFILINIAYFVSLHFFGANTFTSPLSTHLTSSAYGAWAASLVDAKLAQTAQVHQDYARNFNTRSAVAAKSLIFLMIPMYALLLAAVHARSRRYFVEHLVFATHFMAWWLLIMMTAINLVIVLLTATDGLSSFDLVATAILLGFILLYFFVGLRRVYSAGRWLAAAKALALTVATFGVVILYRFLLFVICYALT